MPVLAVTAALVALATPATPASRAVPPPAPDADLVRLCHGYDGSGVSVDLSGTRYAPEQARDPRRSVAAIDARQSMLLLPDGHFLLRTSTLYPGDIEFRFKTVGSRQGEQTIDELGWRDGDVVQLDDAAAAAKDASDLRMLVPALLACDAHAHHAVGDAAGVHYRDDAGRAVTLRLAAGTITGAEIGPEHYRYGGWPRSGDDRQPQDIERVKDGHVVAHWTAARLAPARAQDAALLTIPPRYRPADDAGKLRATPLGNGAYRIDGAPSGYHTGFVVGTATVAVFDAPIAEKDAASVRALIAQIAPNRRVGYVVVSHVHGDHIAGLAAYPDAEILTGLDGALAIRRQFASHAPFRVRELSAPTQIDLGGQAIALFPFASSHATTMLVGYAPASKAVFQGDLFYLPERGTVPAAFTTGRELEHLISERHLDVAAIVGVHGRTGTMRDLRQAIALMRTGANDRGGIGEMAAR